MNVKQIITQDQIDNGAARNKKNKLKERLKKKITSIKLRLDGQNVSHLVRQKVVHLGQVFQRRMRTIWRINNSVVLNTKFACKKLQQLQTKKKYIIHDQQWFLSPSLSFFFGMKNAFHAKRLYWGTASHARIVVLFLQFLHLYKRLVLITSPRFFPDHPHKKILDCLQGKHALILFRAETPRGVFSKSSWRHWEGLSLRQLLSNQKSKRFDICSN